MVIFKSFNEIVLSLIEYLRTTQVNLDTKPGTVARDLFVDAPAEEIALLYNSARNISALQSFLAATGTDLVKLGSNFGVSKALGSPATGVAVFTTNNLDNDILIPTDTIVTSRSGVTFKTTATTQLRASNANVYRSNATRLQTDLELGSITDTFAVEITVEALTVGTGGNIGPYSLISQNVAGISNITNLESFSGGTNAESDSEYRARILSVFAGSNTGTALGYETEVSTVSGVQDVEVVVPGDPLLTRDGTETATDINGNTIVSDPGTGGKVDIYALGTRLESRLESFIYQDQSGLDDPTDSSNDVTLGQRGQDTTLSSSQRRVELLENDLLPFQPINGIVSITGSSSGSNFVEKFTDTDGTVKGNYELLKDTGDLGGSPFGFDKLVWISNKIDLLDEEVTKGIFNGSDALLFADATEITDITQDVFVTNENSITSTTDRSNIKLLHTPVRTVSRAVNLTTGERYVVSNQNPDGTTGELNTTGNVTISGNTLPVATDVLQVDYTWVKPYDSVFDFDNLTKTDRFRTVQDSVDWSFGNRVEYEPGTIADDGYGNLTVEVTHNISKVLAVDTFVTESVSVSEGTVTMSSVVSNIIDMKRDSDSAEIYNTDGADGTISGTVSVILPSDTLAADGDSVTVRYNATDVYTSDAYGQGSVEANTITLPEDAGSVGTSVLVTYIANVRTLLPTNDLSSLPALISDYQFSLSGEVVGNQPISNLEDSNSNIIQNLRRAASHLRVTVSSIGSAGILNITGTTLHKVDQKLLVVTSGSGYDINLSSLIKSDLGVSSLPTGTKVVKLESVERVDVDSAGLIESVDNVYDVTNYFVGDTSYDLGVAIEDSSLSSTSISLPRTSDNTTAILSVADVVRVTFYYVVPNKTEQLYFSRNGVRTTDNIFHKVDRIAISSGFNNPSGVVTGDILVTNYNQPIENTTYNVDYDYTAPKENERITVTYNTNEVPRDATLEIEDVRPITADVLIKEATAKDVDVTIKVVLLSEFEDSETTVLQDAVDATTSFLNSNTLGTTVDASDLVSNLYSVSGIDRARVINFSNGDSGNKLSITANKTEYLRAGIINITAEDR